MGTIPSVQGRYAPTLRLFLSDCSFHSFHLPPVTQQDPSKCRTLLYIIIRDILFLPYITVWTSTVPQFPAFAKIKIREAVCQFSSVCSQTGKLTRTLTGRRKGQFYGLYRRSKCPGVQQGTKAHRICLHACSVTTT